MPIGTSDGHTFDDEWQYAASALHDTGTAGKAQFLLQPSYGRFDDTPTIHSGMEQSQLEKPTEDYLKSVEAGMEMQQVQTDMSQDENNLSKAYSQDISESKHYDSAVNDMKLTPEEQALYQMHLKNLNGPGGVDNPDGTRSTLYQAVEEHNGKFYNVPTVWNGKKEVEQYTNSKGEVLDVPNDTALDNINKTGWDKFPSYATPEEADKRYGEMHKYMEQDTKDYQSKPHSEEEHDNTFDKLYDKLSETWPAEAVKTLKKVFMLPGRVYKGEVASDSDEAINTAAEFALAFGTGGLESAGKDTLSHVTKKMAKETITSPLDTAKLERTAQLAK